MWESYQYWREAVQSKGPDARHLAIAKREARLDRRADGLWSSPGTPMSCTTKLAPRTFWKSTVAYLKLDVPLVELWPRITRVQFVQFYQEKGLQNLKPKTPESQC